MGQFHFADCPCDCEQRRKGLGKPTEDRATGLLKTPLIFKTSAVNQYVTKRMDSGPFNISYDEYRGIGHPMERGQNFGRVGDTYIDLTPGKYQLYAKISPCYWAAWPGPYITIDLLRHPLYPNRILFYNESPRGSYSLGWCSSLCSALCELILPSFLAVSS